MEEAGRSVAGARARRPSRGRGHARAALAAAAIAAVLAAALAGAAPAHAESPLRLWTAGAFGRIPVPDRAAAVADARRFDLITAHPTTYRRHLAAMRAANPAFRVVAYVNATFVGRGQGDAFPDEWYLRDAAGNKVQSIRFGNYMMNPAEPGWIETRVRLCRTLVAQSGYDGCQLDVLGTSPVRPGYTTGVAINPATGRPWTIAGWLAATSNLAAVVRQRLAPAFVIGNGITDGPRYFDPAGPSARLFDALDVVIAEGFLRTGRAPIAPFPTRADWKKNVDMLVDAGARGHRMLVVTKTWTDGTAEEKDRWHRLALASFLLGTDGRHGFVFTYAEGQDATAVHPWWDADLGAALRPYGFVGGVYGRRFERGLVLVNPFAATKTVALDGAYRNLAGQVVTSARLRSMGATILVRAG
jgi:hypothetical protein